ncbi:MAG: hypothetical protein K5866_06490 [Treponema sp.]|nr:hypothetical protein [Treponema sp.]
MKKLLSVLFILFLVGSAYGQSSKVISQILEEDEITFGQLCYLSTVYQGLADENVTFKDAINVLYERGQIPYAAYETNGVALINLAFVYSQIWDIKGGMMYKITHGSPRYALRQLKSDGIIPARYDPHKMVSGSEALDIFTACSLKYQKR